MRWEAWPPLVALSIGIIVFVGAIVRVVDGSDEDRDLTLVMSMMFAVLFVVSFGLVIRLGAP